LKYNYSPPILLQKIFSDFVWNSSNNKILLTFDDGPTQESTERILQILSSNKINAVFFCVGNNVNNHPLLTEKILSARHTIANHSMNHKLLTSMDREESIQELLAFNSMMKDKFNYDVKYFRPAHGRFNLKTNGLMKELHMKCVMWNLLTYDFENNIEKVKYAIEKYLQRNSIIVFHDNIKSKEIIETALNYTIDLVGKRNFEFGEPADCLK
jgi:peptidoglycan/xylan/chitin deacetylase (PgdA/CDA1 family)